MSANRKLQAEIAQVLKKVEEGVLLFDDIWDKVYAAGQQSLKEKYEGDLKKEIKKLQRLRDQVKNWLGSSEVKEKNLLIEARKIIESKMEQFKVCEKDTKTKAYSKEGLAREARTDPKEIEREEKRNWLNDCLERLVNLINSIEVDVEKITSVKGGKIKNKDQLEKLENRLQKNRWHSARLEQILKLLDNEDMDPSELDSIKDDVDYYIESAADDEGAVGVDDEFDIYEDLQLAIIVASGAEDGASASDAVGSLAVPADASAASEADAGVAKKPPAAPISAVPVIGKQLPIPPTPVKQALPTTVTASPLKAAPVAPTIVPTKSLTPASPGKISLSPSLTGAVGVGMAAKPLNAPVEEPVAAAAPQSSWAAHAASSSVSPQKVVAVAPAVAPQVIPQPLTEVAAAVVPVPAPSPASSSSIAASTPMFAQTSLPPALEPSVAVGIPSSAQQQAASQQLTASAIAQARATGPSPVQQQINAAQIPAPNSLHQLQQQQLQQQQAMQQSHQAQQNSFQQQQQQQQPNYANSSQAAGRGSLTLNSDVQFTISMLKQSALNSTEVLESDRLTGYAPRNQYNTHPSFPSQPPPVIESGALFERLPADSLFFAFYHQQGSYQQFLAAKQLKKQSWRFHKKYMTWFQRHEEPKVTSDDYEEGTYVYFDYESGWCQRIKSEFKFEYNYLEDETAQPTTN